MNRAWFDQRESLALLADWVAERGAPAKTVAYAIEKPWKYLGTFRLAEATQAHELTNPTGNCHVQVHDDHNVYCGGADCNWAVQWDGHALIQVAP